MNETALWAMAIDKGLPFCLLIVAVAYFYRRDKRNEEKAEKNSDRCREQNDHIMGKLVEMNEKLSAALQSIGPALQTIANVAEEQSRREQNQSGAYHQPTVTTHAR